jgi:CelD/BcsL family acetyltransferase involved in cellulose biosynthesis
MRLIQLTNADQLSDLAGPWDALWRASEVAAPAARAALVQLWLEHFAPRARFRCLAVEEDGALLAALPLVQTRVRGILPAGGVVANCWSAAGQLLVDPVASDSALDLLTCAIEQLPWPLLWLEGINPTTDGWRRFLAACDRAGVPYEFRHDRDVGLIDITHDWLAYEASWSKNHARNLSKSQRRLEQAGEVAFHAYRVRDEAQAQSLFERALNIEERSWKARAGTSVASHPAASSFFARQVRQLASWDALDFCFLDLNGRPIAFEYGYRAKGVHLAHKTGYDEAFAAFSPGQLVMQEVLRSLHGDFEVDVLDCLGPINDALSRWTTRTYPEGRLLLAARTPAGQALAWAYRTARRCCPRHLRRGQTGSSMGASKPTAEPTAYQDD